MYVQSSSVVSRLAFISVGLCCWIYCCDDSHLMYRQIIICNFQTKTNPTQFLLINIRYSDIVTNTMTVECMFSVVLVVLCRGC